MLNSKIASLRGALRSCQCDGAIPCRIRQGIASRHQRLNNSAARNDVMGFTLVELLIAFSIFVIVMGLVLASVTGLFRTSSQVQSLVDIEQKQRMCLLRLSREIASLTRITYPQHKFKGTQQDLFFIFAKEDGLVEAHYVCNQAGSLLERFSEEPPDFKWDTFQKRETCLSAISVCSFSYADGDQWLDTWAEEKGALPVMIKVTFQSQGDNRVREFVVHIPVSS